MYMKKQRLRACGMSVGAAGVSAAVSGIWDGEKYIE